jgi:parallel beta-helix repeat protein
VKAMKRKALALMMVLLFSMVAGTQLVNLTHANFTPLPELPTPIYIREDGTIEGAEGAIQKTGNTYTFVRDINKTIEIHKDNIILEGTGFTLTKPPKVNTAGLMTPIGWFPSIRISNRDNIIISNILFDRCYTSISVENSSSVIVIQNTMSNGNEGIYMSLASNCSVIGNEITDCSHTGLDIKDSTFLNIAYNTISRNHFHGGWIAVSNSNISRNDITDNSFDHFGIGLYLYGPNSNNRIFENNFINNEIGLFYQGSRGSSVNNRVYDNYWNNYQDAIVNVAADAISGVDQSPLLSPISTSFDPSHFLPPPLTLTPSPEPPSIADSPEPASTPTEEPQQTERDMTGGAILAAASIVVFLGVLVYFIKRR